MIYVAKNVDTEKALEAIQDSRRIQEQYEHVEREKTRAYYEGVRKGLDIAESIFRCSNYEKPDPIEEAES